MRTAGALVAVLVGALACWAMAGTGFANYDLAYSLVWGDDLAHGRLPDYDALVAPTPHPLTTLEGLLLAPLDGPATESAATALAYLALGALGVVVYALGATWFGPVAGVIAAAIVLTRQPVLSFGVRGYLDIPYLALVLAAVLVEARRPRAGVGPLLLLGLAGLLRPEAWLFAVAYVGYLRLSDPEPQTGRYVRLGLLALAAPLVWTLSDLLVTGDPLYSLTGTQENADVLQRRTGLDEVPITVPRRLGEILREPVLVGAAAGGILALLYARRQALLGAATGIAALAAFCVLAAAGLPILGRYLLLPAAILAIFCAAAITGWRDAPDGRPRRVWQAAAVLTVALLVVLAPAQVERIRSLHRAIAIQREIRDDLVAIAPALGARCGPIAVPNHRPVPLLALYLGRPPRTIVSAQVERPDAGTFLDPASSRVERNYTLDRNDPGRLVADPPPGFRPVARNRSWVVLASCPPPG